MDGRLRGQSSASAAVHTDYDVFLNHRGPDVKAGFVAHLDEALRAAGLNPFLDKASLRKGDAAFRSIDDALEVAKVHVAVVSKGYSESKYCLSELVAMMRSGKPVIPVYYDVEPAQLRRVENGPFAAAFEKHQARESAEQVEEWREALRQLADITGFCFRLSDYEGNEVGLKWKVVDTILNLMPRVVEHLKGHHQLVGVKEHLNTCIKKLEMMDGATCLLGLAGMGGIGKTSLAKEIYKHYVGHKKFEAMSFLEVDRNSSSSMQVGASLLCRLRKQVLWDLLQVPHGNQQNYEYWYHKLASGGPILIVLDDIHDRSLFDELILDPTLLPHGSCIMVTSRDRQLLKDIGRKFDLYLHEVTPLRFDDGQELFNLHAFGSEEAPKELESLVNNIVIACGGLPLALKVVGSSLLYKRSEEDLDSILQKAMDALKRDRGIMGALRWSYDCLPESEKQMFVDIACVLYGWKKREALEIWKSCTKCLSCSGLSTPHTSLGHLIDKSLVVLDGFPDDNLDEGLIMHGLLRDLGESIGIANESHLWGNTASKVEEASKEGQKKVRALNFANSDKRKVESKHFARMPNLHFLVLDGCDLSGNLECISKELRWLQWRDMPLAHFPHCLNLSNLTSLDFSRSSKLVETWVESNLALEGCPNLIRLNLSDCTSITSLSNSMGCLSRLQMLNLMNCTKLQTLPSSIGQLSALHTLYLGGCRSLEALPDTITALPELQVLMMSWCSSISKLPIAIGLMTSLTNMFIDLATEWQAANIGYFKALKDLTIWQHCTDESINVLDRLETFKNLDQLSILKFNGCPTMTKLPKTIGLLSTLTIIMVQSCEKLQEFPNSIGKLQMLKSLVLLKCNNLETLPESFGSLTSFLTLAITQCASFTKLPTSFGHLSKLLILVIEGCSELQPLPNSFKQLNALKYFSIMDCGSLEGLGLLKVLQGLHMWGCTSITDLPGSCLLMLNSNCFNPTEYYKFNGGIVFHIYQTLKELEVVEVNDCGSIRHVQDIENGRFIVQRIYNSPCSMTTT